jgi:alpha-D-xyloside xylohydrolase
MTCSPRLQADAGSILPDNVTRSSRGVLVRQGAGWLKIQAISDNIFRIAFAPDPAFFDRPSLAVVPQAGIACTTEADSRRLTVSTAALKASLDLATGAITFLDFRGKILQVEKPRSDRNLQPAVIEDRKTFHVWQQWDSFADESLYGLGENQLGLTDIKGYDLDLWQHNGTIVVPLLVSSRGYGILWDNNAFTRFGDLRPFQDIPPQCLLAADGKPGGITASYFSDPQFKTLLARRTEQQINIERRPESDEPPPAAPSPLGILPSSQGSVRWEGTLVPPADGAYQFQAFSDGQIRSWIDGKLVMDSWRQGWLPWKDLARLELKAGHRYPIRIEWSRQGGSTIQLLWKPPVETGPSRDTDTSRDGSPSHDADPPISLWSEAGDGIDYYFISGPRVDDVIAGYRKLTGAAPMMPRWAFGLWQSRQRYETQDQSLDVVEGYRQRGIPLDNIVQDWRYWPEGAWGSHQFDPDRFPDPQAWIDAIHREHANLMISVWGKFYPGTDNFTEMQKAGYLYPENLKEKVKDWLGFEYTFFDAFNPGARQLFWKQMRTALFQKGVDAWWLDATEPDILPRPTLVGQRSHMTPTALGPGAFVLNAYSLMESKAVYEGQRQAAPDKRVCILTRSGFAGLQRFSAACWSGDSSSSWQALRGQVPAGIGFCLSGIPYWTMDVGGFSVPHRFTVNPQAPEDADEWAELNTRWFEFGAFCPFLRVHGEFPLREMWEFGGDSSPAYQAQLKSDRLRYQLLPYIYSLAGAVTRGHSTIMRGLVMDFPGDEKARRITDQYMFGPAFLVNPVYIYRARSRDVYLPQGPGWYDFWTNHFFAGGQSLSADAPYDAMPIFVRAGSIVPTGPELQFTAEKPADPITLTIYAGADASFDLYEDDGLTNAYEKGQFSVIPLRWNDSARTLFIAARQGGFAGMLKQRTFNVRLITKDRQPPEESTGYSGDAVEIHFDR